MATLLSDTFTDTDNTALTAHTMDVGPGWTADVGTYFVLTNKATPSSNADDDQTHSDAAVADVTLTCDIVPRGVSGVWTSDPGLLMRWTDSTHLWLCHSTVAAADGFILYENTGGGYVQRASSTSNFVSGTTYSIEVDLTGSTIVGKIGGVQQWSYGSATSNQTATKFGLRTGASGVIVTKCTWDIFLVTGTVASQPWTPWPLLGPILAS